MVKFYALFLQPSRQNNPYFRLDFMQNIYSTLFLTKQKPYTFTPLNSSIGYTDREYPRPQFSALPGAFHLNTCNRL